MPVSIRAALLATALALAPAAALADEAARVPTLALDVTGTVSAPPDTAVVVLGVETEDATPGPALAANNARMRETIDALLAAGIAERDVETSEFRIEPIHVYPKDGEDAAPRIRGYRVSNVVTVRIREIATAGRLIDEVVRIGANDVRGIGFSIENDEVLLDRARREAMREARARAELYAEAGGFGLGRLLAVREGAGGAPVPRFKEMTRMAADGVPVQAGEQDLSVTIGVEWEIVREP